MAPGLYIAPGFADPVNSGTSFACPNRAAVLGMAMKFLVLANPTIMPADRAVKARDALQKGSIPLGYENDPNLTPEQAWCIQGPGYVNAKNTADLITGTQPPQPGRRAAAFYDVGTVTVSPRNTEQEPTVRTVTFDKSSYVSDDPVKMSILVEFQSDNAPVAERILTAGLAGVFQTVTLDADGRGVATLTAPTVTHPDTNVPWSLDFRGE